MKFNLERMACSFLETFYEQYVNEYLKNINKIYAV